MGESTSRKKQGSSLQTWRADFLAPRHAARWQAHENRRVKSMVDMTAKPFYLSESDCKWVEDTIAEMTEIGRAHV